MNNIFLILTILTFILVPISLVILFINSVNKFIRVLRDRKNKVETYKTIQLVESITYLILTSILLLPVLTAGITLILVFTGVIPFM